MDWARTSPVIHLSFARLDTRERTLTASLSDELIRIGQGFGIRLQAPTLKEKHTELIEKLCQRQGQVAILIDEYDKPITDFLGRDELPTALENR
ncbi:MAG: AAA family ATPase, partial [Bernardetiaceae bacterium]|nr:AAA family ATPase [Bernardetiaceae bacterium]